MTRGGMTKADLKLALCLGLQQWDDTGAIRETVLRCRVCMYICM